jgi:LPS sulfotransferase NodH
VKLADVYDGPIEHLLDEKYDFPWFEGPPKVYLIASTPRSGSGLISHLLHSTRLVGAPFEYFKPACFWGYRRIVGSSDPNEVLRGIYARRTGPTGWFGLKAHPPFFRYLKSRVDFHPVQVIRTRRRDLLDQAVSLAIATQTGAWASFQKPSGVAHYDKRAIETAYTSLLSMDAWWDAYFAETEVAPTVVYYEDTARAPETELARVLKTLGVGAPDTPLKPIAPQKQGGQVNREWKERYLQEPDALVPAVAGTA